MRRKLQTTKGGIIVCHSHWEAWYAMMLDKDATVLYFEKDSILVPYKFGRSSRIRTYKVDFLVQYCDYSVNLVEIKPSWYLTHCNKTKAKKQAAEKWCLERDWKFRFVTELDCPDFKNSPAQNSKARVYLNVGQKGTKKEKEMATATQEKLAVGTKIQYFGWKQKPEETEPRNGVVKSVARKWVEVTRDNGKNDWTTMDKLAGPFAEMAAGETGPADGETATEEEAGEGKEESETPKPSTEEQTEPSSTQTIEDEENADDLEEDGDAVEVKEPEQPAVEVASKKSTAKPKKKSNGNNNKKAKNRRK
jgi:hypothetical protein